MIRFVVAIDDKRGMADDHGIPWDLPTDQKYFVDQTRDGLILMGYGTYLEFSKPMHGHVNYVATRKPGALRDGFVAVPDVAQFFAEHEGDTINDIGGAGLFASTIQFADLLLITRVQGDFNCTKFFPEFEDDFKLIRSDDPISENGITFHYETWQK